jgi:uncharacterized C2H2 Zn-finger protein
LGDLRPYICLSQACPAASHEFSERRQWIQHVSLYHGNASDDLNCPLCPESLPDVREYLRHVGGHQLELALFALPILPEENPEYELTGDESTDLFDMSDESEEV